MLARFEAQLADKLAEIADLTVEAEGLRADIAEMRATLPRTAPRSTEPVTMRAVLQGMPSIVIRDVEVPPDANTMDLVRAALEASEGPVPAKVIVERVNGIRETDPTNVHRALYRLKEAGEVDVTGTRPNSLYALKPAQAEKQTALQMAK